MNNKMILCGILVFFTGMIVASDGYYTDDIVRMQVANAHELGLYDPFNLLMYPKGIIRQNNQKASEVRATGDWESIKNERLGNYEIKTHQKIDNLKMQHGAKNSLIFKSSDNAVDIFFDEENKKALLERGWYQIDYQKKVLLNEHWLHLIDSSIVYSSEKQQVDVISLKLSPEIVQWFGEEKIKKLSRLLLEKANTMKQKEDTIQWLSQENKRLDRLVNVFGFSCLGLVIIFMAYLKFR